MSIDVPSALQGVSATLLSDGSIDIAGNTLRFYPAQKEDRNFIIATWMNSYRQVMRKLSVNHGVWCGVQWHVPEKIYNTYHSKIPESLWVHTAVLKAEEDGPISAYICRSESCLHYSYVIPELRRLGLFKAMLGWAFKEPKVMVSHVWPFRDNPRFVYNPYAAWSVLNART